MDVKYVQFFDAENDVGDEENAEHPGRASSIRWWHEQRSRIKNGEFDQGCEATGSVGCSFMWFVCWLCAQVDEGEGCLYNF